MKFAGIAVVVLALGAVLWLVLRPGGVAAKVTAAAAPAPQPSAPSTISKVGSAATSVGKTAVNLAILPITGPIGYLTGFHL